MTGRKLSERIVPFTAGDGYELNLINVRGSGDRGPVLLSHGAGVRGELFRPRTQPNFVDALIEAGYDVWLENWRASIDPAIEPSNWVLDEAAVYDHPAAVQTILEETGADTLKAVVHCQGSTSFCMSAAAGLVPEVDTIVASACSLLVNVPKFSRFKLSVVIPVLNRFADAIQIGTSDQPDGIVDRLLRAAARLTHRRCDNTACKMVSMVYGAGDPALWLHENLTDDVHDNFIPTEFGRVPLSFFLQMRRCIKAGELVSVAGFDELPARFGAQPPKTDARFVLITGEKNRCFDPKGQRRTFAMLDELNPGKHAIHVFRGYSHLDVFFGEHAARDTFPTLLRELQGGV